MAAHSHTTAADEVTPSYDLVVSLGTDYHKFDRLVQWVDAYLAQHPELTCLFQHGFTDPPQRATATVDRMPRKELLKIYEASKVVLVQGGPGSILDAREVGVIPLAVPRVAELDEVVDNHQVEFSKVMESYGETIIVHDAADLAAKIDAALADPSMVAGSYRVPGADTAAAELARAFETFAPSPGHDVRKFVRRWGQVLRGMAGR
ncbi:glycosyltransferase [Rothia sp. LK2588]|uniref:glycosyltransferase n=1 Tax=Rothia sp. LK2588 TaxID=3114369 RepID=UPI0034CE3796